jgi:TPP-dependent pyruvate/acetoin dehydrogenase alpha subunit
VSTAVRQGVAAEHLTDLAAPFGVPAAAIDGADVDEVAAAVSAALVEIRAGSGPRFIEMRCTRLGPHSTATREERPKAEQERFRDTDPVVRYEQRLRTLGVLNDVKLAALQAGVATEIAAAERYAADAAWPDCDEALRDV